WRASGQVQRIYERLGAQCRASAVCQRDVELGLDLRVDVGVDVDDGNPWLPTAHGLSDVVDGQSGRGLVVVGEEQPVQIGAVVRAHHALTGDCRKQKHQ